MPGLNREWSERDILAANIAYAPSEVADAAIKVAFTASRSFGPFVPGDSVVVASTQPFHMIATRITGTATTSHPAFPAGVYKFVMPEGMTYVNMIDTSAGAGIGQVYKG